MTYFIFLILSFGANSVLQIAESLLVFLCVSKAFGTAITNVVSSYYIQQYPLPPGCIRNVHYPLKSGNFVQSVEKNRARKNFLARFVVEVTGFEFATFWFRKTGHASVIVRQGPLLLREKQDYAGPTRTI